MFSYSPNFYQERLQRLVVRCISICRAVIRHLQRSKLTRDMMVMKAVTAWCCCVRSAAPEIQFPTEQRGSILYSFLLYPLHKIFSHLQNKKVRNNVFVYKIDFWHGKSGPVMAFIPDNISVHVHLLEDNDPIKKQRWLLSAGFFSLADFPQKQQKCFSEDHYWFISVDSVGRERSKLFQVVVLILEAVITFFLFKLQRQQCASLERCICIDIYTDFLADHLTFQVFERGLESEPVGGEILFGVAGGGGGGGGGGRGG